MPYGDISASISGKMLLLAPPGPQRYGNGLEYALDPSCRRFAAAENYDVDQRKQTYPNRIESAPRTPNSPAATSSAGDGQCVTG